MPKGYYYKTVRDSTGAAVENADVTVSNPDGSEATVEDSGGNTLTQPLSTNAKGEFEFYVEFGEYTVEVTFDGETVTLEKQFIGNTDSRRIGEFALQAFDLSSPDYIAADGGTYNGDLYPDLAPLMQSAGTSGTKATGTPSLPTGTSESYSTSYSSDGSLVAIAFNGTSPYIEVYNTSDYTRVTAGDLDTAIGNAAYVCRFSPDGAYLAVGSYASPHLFIFDTANWTTITYGPSFSNPIRELSWSADNAYLAVGSDNKMEVLDRSDWSAVSITSFTNDQQITAIEFRPDSTELALFRGTEFILLNTSDWSVVSGTPTPSDTVNSIEWTSDSSKLIRGGGPINEDNLIVYNRSDWSTVTITDLPGTGGETIEEINLSPDNSYLGVAMAVSPYAEILNVADWTSSIEISVTETDKVRGVGWANNSRIAFCGSTDPYFEIFDISDNGFIVPDMSTAPPNSDYAEWRIRAL